MSRQIRAIKAIEGLYDDLSFFDYSDFARLLRVIAQELDMRTKIRRPLKKLRLKK